MVVIARLSLRVGVYQRGGQARQRMEQAVLGVDRDLVSLDGAGLGVDDDAEYWIWPPKAVPTTRSRPGCH